MRTALLIAIVCCVSAVCGSRAEAADEYRMRLKTKRLIVFKDGYALVIKEGVGICDKNGEMVVDEVPDAAVLGSFWAGQENGDTVGLKASWVSVTNSVTLSEPCVQLTELLRANTGQVCRVDLASNIAVNGTIQEVLVREELVPIAPSPSVPAFLTSTYGRPHSTLEAGALRGAFFVLRTTDGDMWLPLCSWN